MKAFGHPGNGVLLFCRHLGRMSIGEIKTYYKIKKAPSWMPCSFLPATGARQKVCNFFNYTRSTLPDLKALVDTQTRLGLPSTRIRTF